MPDLIVGRLAHERGTALAAQLEDLVAKASRFLEVLGRDRGVHLLSRSTILRWMAARDMVVIIVYHVPPGVTPAKAGVLLITFADVEAQWTPAFAGMTPGG